MALYPSLEDMKVDQMMRIQNQALNEISLSSITTNQDANQVLYPALGEYMGLSDEIIERNLSEDMRVSLFSESRLTNDGMIAPLSDLSVGRLKAQVTHGIREVILCKDAKNKIGLRVKAVNHGIFVCLVQAGSPAALVGLRFGDQILQVNNVNVAGYTMDQVHDMLRKSPVNGICVVVRDRPFERTITLHKDSTGHVGFQFKNGKINSLVKDSSAARNGVLTDHQFVEINGQNVVGLKDKEIRRIIEGAGQVITITVIPTFIYDHIIKNMASSLLKGSMDHSVPAV